MTETELAAALSQFTTDELVGEWSRRLDTELAALVAESRPKTGLSVLLAHLLKVPKVPLQPKLDT